jgi:hypothetical protein
MALCHEERDYAMGFSRVDPHAPRCICKGEREADGVVTWTIMPGCPVHTKPRKEKENER